MVQVALLSLTMIDTQEWVAELAPWSPNCSQASCKSALSHRRWDGCWAVLANNTGGNISLDQCERQRSHILTFAKMDVDP